MKFFIKLSLLAFLSLSLTGCSKDENEEETQEETPAPQNPVSEYNIVGKWSFPDSDQNGNFTGYYTFYANQTMLVEDRDDLFNGGTVNYSYNAVNHQLSIMGLVRTIYWDSPNQFHQLETGNFVGRTYTRVN